VRADGVVAGAAAGGGGVLRLSRPRRCSRPTLRGRMVTLAADLLTHQLIPIISNYN
jgi:hypothetical protein